MQKHNQKGEIPLMTPELAKQVGAQFPNQGKPLFRSNTDNQPQQMGRTQFMHRRRHHGQLGDNEEESE